MINKDDLHNVHLAWEDEKNLDVYVASTNKLKAAIRRTKENNPEARTFSDMELITLANLQEVK